VTEGDFRERLLHAVLRWQHRLAGGPSSSAAASIAQEMAELRGIAQANGWSTVQHLLYLENVAQTDSRNLSQALSATANVLRLANVPVSGYTMPLDQALRRAPAPMAASGSSQPGSLALRASPVPRREADSIAPPPLIGGPLPVAPSPLPASADVLPDSQIKPRPPPNLFKSILGLSAIWKKPGARDRPPGVSRPSGRPLEPAGKGLLGFSALSSEAARPVPSPIPAGPGFGSRRPRPGSPRGSDRPTPAKAGRGSRSHGLGSTPEPAVPRWFYVLIGSVGLLGVATIVMVIVFGRTKSPVLRPEVNPDAMPSSTVTSTSPSAQGPSMPDVHKMGKETERLHALLDLQGKAASKCRDSRESCGDERGWTANAVRSLTPAEVTDLVPLSRDAQLPSWIRSAHLRTLPRDLTLRDEPVLRQLFWNYTHSRGGQDNWISKQNVQDMLYKCSAYSAIFDDKFGFYHVPSWLEAVVFQESQCNPVVESPAHAKGLWQFMAETATIYGLRVNGQMDERLNPEKATDAAVRFLSDLHEKFGAWDLAFAAYNAGPYAVASPLTHLGDKFGFWDLVHAHLLPKETVGYVPAIEAYALVLENSTQWFSPDGKRAERTMAINVKSGTRLSLIARAARTSTKRIRELNLEFLTDHVPEGETTASVPEAEASGAQAFLDKWAPDDNKDTCVPDDFDWGLKQFEHSEYAKACRGGL
jgi:hypothetical protein